MTISRQSKAVADMLLVLAGDSQVAAIAEKPWHSATFAGQRLALKMRLNGADSSSRAQALKRILPDYEFTLSRYFVADASVASISLADDAAMMEIEILLLEE